MLASQHGDTASGLADNKRVLEALYDANSRFFDRNTHQWSFVGMSRFTGANQWDRVWPRVLMVGRACTNQGILLGMAGRNGEAAQVLEEAIAVQQILSKQNSRAGQVRHGLALALLHCGRVKAQLGLPGRAEPALREALRLMQRLVEDDSHVKEYRATRMLAAGFLGEALFRQGRTAAAAVLLREAKKEGEEVHGGPRKNLRLRAQHARLLLVLGCLEGDSGHLDRGLEVCLSAHEKLEALLRKVPGDRSMRSDWLASREALARYRFLKGGLSRDRWIAEQQVILKERKDLVGDGPPSPRFQGEAAGSAVVLAGLLLEAGRPAEALACVEEVLPAHEKVVRREQDRVKAQALEQKDAVHTLTVQRYEGLTNNR
jgi:tetratricopeptide (TPR) repeat protein